MMVYKSQQLCEHDEQRSQERSHFAREEKGGKFQRTGIIGGGSTGGEFSLEIKSNGGNGSIGFEVQMQG
jgi:hypothetical protein